MTAPLSDPSGKPIIAMTQPTGDPGTTFVVQGRGWLPGTDVTITLKGFGSSRIHPPVDGAGSFNYAVNQDHDFFRGGLPPGRYTVIVTGPTGRKATARFSVIPPPGGPPPP